MSMVSDFRLRTSHKLCKIVWIILFLPLAEASNKEKRDLFHFGEMIWQVTGKNPLSFTNYGNFCGYGGDGKAVDPLDHCCEVHDACYTYVQSKSDCWSSTLLSLITERYKYEIVNKTVVCAKENDTCSQLGCICDKALSECLKEFLHLYDERNRG